MPTDQERSDRLAEIEKAATDLGLNPATLELKNSEGNLKTAGRLRDMAGNANTYFGNLQEQAELALSEVDSKAATTRAGVYKAQAAFIQDAIDFLEDPNPGMDPAKLANVEASLGVYKELNDSAIGIAKDVEQIRLGMYTESIKAATQQTLKERGYTPQEIDTFATASTKQLMGIMADLKTDQGMADDLANKMNQNLQNNTTQISSLDENASKLHNAMAQAFNTSLVVELDGEQRLKPALEGSAYGRFSMGDADAHIQAAAADNGVTLTAEVMAHQQMEQSDVYQVGKELKKGAPPPTQSVQASDTFKATSNQVLDDTGATVAFGKNQVGTRVERMKAAGITENAVEKAAQKDIGLVGTVAPLYGTTAQVEKAMGDGSMQRDLKAKVKALEGDPSGLLTRSVATSAVNKALGMNAVAEEKFGVDETGKAVGLSVGVAGAPILKVSDDPMAQEEFLDLDYSEPAIQKGLSDLQVQDYITGQIDRHTGNIFVDPKTNEVKGIDNDLAFPVVDREEMIKNPDVQKKAVAGKPAFIHVDTADKIEALDPAELRKTLESIKPPPGVAPLEPAAINGAVQRLQELQDHVKELRKDGKLVTAFDDNTYAQSVATQEAVAPGQKMGINHGYERTSYLGSAVLEQVKTGEKNKSDKDYDHRKMVKAGDVPPPQINESYAAFKQGVQETKKTLAENSDAIGDPALGAAVKTAQQKVAGLEKQLAEQTQDLAGVNARLQGARSTNNAAVVAPLEAASLEGSNERQETLRSLKTARQELDGALNKAVEPYKPELAQKANIQALEKTKALEPGLQGKVAQATAAIEPAQQRLETAKTRLETAQKAEGEVWDKVLGEGGVSNDAAELATNELDAATKEVNDASKALDDATKTQAAAAGELKACQTKIASLEKRVASNQLSLEAGQHLQVGAQQSVGVTPPPLPMHPVISQERNQAIVAAITAAGLDPADFRLKAKDNSLRDPKMLRSEGSDCDIDAMGKKDMVQILQEDEADLQEETTLAQFDVEIATDKAQAYRDMAEIMGAEGPGVDPAAMQKLQNSLGNMAVNQDKKAEFNQGYQERRAELYKQEVGAAVQQTLENRGLSEAEIKVFTDATVAMGLKESTLRNVPDQAKQYGQQLNEALQSPQVQMADMDPDANRLLNAMCQANGAFIQKSGIEGIEDQLKFKSNSFRPADAQAALEVAAEAHGVELEPGSAQLDVEAASFAAELDQLQEKRAKLEHPDAGDRIKNFFKHGPKGADGALAQVDKQIAAVQQARDAALSGVSLDDQKQDVAKLKQKQQDAKQGVKDLEKAEKTIASIERKAALNESVKDMGMGKTMSSSERDMLVKEANKAINVREALKPKEQSMKDDAKQLGKDVKQGEKAVQVRQALGAHRTPSGGGGGKSHGV